MNLASNTSIKKVTSDGIVEQQDQLTVEEPLEISIAYTNGEAQVQKTVSITMRTPGNDEELALGFLFTEGIILAYEDILNAEGSGNNLLVTLKENKKPFLQNAERNFYTTSSCGVCGKTSIDSIKTVSVYLDEPDNLLIDATIFYKLPRLLCDKQQIFQTTGGLHASALFDSTGNFLMLNEDVGRHNALDKLLGAAFMKNMLPLKQHILLLSGRASFELVQKATMAGIKIIAAIGAPSTLALDLANECGITLVGFLKHDSFNIYSGEQRITFN